MKAEQAYRLGRTFTAVAFVCWMISAGYIFTIGIGAIALALLLKAEMTR